MSLAAARWLAEDDVDLQWLGLLQRAVATVQQDPEGAFDTFVEANHDLQGGLQAQPRKTEMCERRQVEAARGANWSSHGSEPPPRSRACSPVAPCRASPILMDQAWADVLSLTHPRSGEQSDLAGTDRGHRDDHRRQRQQRTAACGPGLRNAPAGCAEQVGYHADDASTIARQLANGRAEDADLASRTELLVQLRARARLGEGTAAAPGTELPTRSADEEAAFRQLRALQEPIWVEFDEDADNTTIRRRLAWISQHTNQTLVVNRRGLRTGGEDLDLLARKLATGKMRLLEVDVAPAEAAWEATMANLQRIAGDEARRPDMGIESRRQAPHRAGDDGDSSTPSPRKPSAALATSRWAGCR
ncbi:MAG: DUF1631 family protein [Thermomonas sp.]|nr:DUF1631 family protein [Thermomonas sp.]